jgi:hypothetical protein
MPDENRARAFWTTGPGVGEIRDERVAPPHPGEVLVETLYSGVSRGTESLVFHGRVPPSEHERMRAPHQAGAFPFPVKYGYQNVGRVVDGAAELIGRVVFCLYPHQSRYVVPAADVVPPPEGVPAARAVVCQPWRTRRCELFHGAASVREGQRLWTKCAGVGLEPPAGARASRGTHNKSAISATTGR